VTARAGRAPCLGVLLVSTALLVDTSAADGLVAPEVKVRARRLPEIAEIYPDLQPDSPLNAYRTPPSSRLAVQTFTAREIDALRPVDVFDLLNHAAGVLSLYQGRKVPYSVRIRGDLHFGYMIDGVYVPSESAARILQTLPVSAIEQVDIVRDGTALTLGPMVDFGRPSGAPNDGFIVIRTRRPRGTETSIAARAERFEGRGANVFTGTAGENAYVSALASRQSTDGRPGEYMARESDAWMVRTGFSGAGLRAEFSAFRDTTTQQFQAADPRRSTLAPQRWSFEPIETTMLAGNFSAQWNDIHSTVAVVSSYRVRATLVAASVLPIEPNIFPNEEQLTNVDVKHSARFGNTFVRFGAQALHWETPTGQSYYEGYPREERVRGLFATLEQGFLDRRLVVDGAVRLDDQHIVRGVDHYFADQRLLQKPAIRDRDLPANRFGSIGAAWTPAPSWKVTARAYAARQGGVESVPAVDNRVLEPEAQQKFEAGVAFSASRAMETAFTVFRTRIRNVKFPAQDVRTRAGVVTSLWSQIDVDRQGFETVVNGVLGSEDRTTHYRFAWTVVGGDTTSEDYGRTTPRNLFNASIRHVRGPWEANVAVIRADEFLSNWRAVDNRFHPIGDYVRMDANVGRNFPVGPALARLSVYGRNVGNARYETQLGYRDPGAIWGVELRVDL
jgi:hypothetical protein